MSEMESNVEQEGLKHLEHIEQELEEIKERTPAPSRSFINGIWQGAGAIVGGILSLALLGWVLGIFGVIPGFVDISHYLQEVMNNFRR